MTLKRSEWAVLIFTVGYVAIFGAIFLSAGNGEFLWYVITLVLFLALVAATQRVARFPAFILWGLSLWGLAHMAGGGVPVGDSVLYTYVLLPLAGGGELVLLKYDQIVHFYGFGVATLVLWHVLRRNFPALDGTRTIYAFAILGGMGLGEKVGIGDQLWVQAVGVIATVAWSVVLTFVIAKAVGGIVGLRVDERDETEGLDLTAHGETGYNL